MHGFRCSLRGLFRVLGFLLQTAFSTYGEMERDNDAMADRYNKASYTTHTGSSIDQAILVITNPTCRHHIPV